MAIQSAHNVPVADIRRDKFDVSLLQLTLAGINFPDHSARNLPTVLLYDEEGLKLFEQITYLEEYYLTDAEIQVLELHADKIANRLPVGSRLLELGSGNLRKVKILLNAFERAGKDVEYIALDLSLSELHRTFAEVSVNEYRHVHFSALHGTYDDGLSWLAKTIDSDKPTCVLSLGSSLGNFSRDEAAAFLRSFGNVLGPTDYLLIGLDACQDSQRVYAAYNDSEGITHAFYRNGLDHANKLIGYKAFKQDDWEIVGRYDEGGHRHEAFYQARKDLVVGKSTFSKGDRLKLEDAYKYSTKQSDVLWHAAGLVWQTAWGNSTDDYHLHFLSPSNIRYPTMPEEYAAEPVPSIRDWHGLWVAWDTVTRGMIPAEELLDKPIKLRNNLIFYLGHIPTFADIHMTRVTASKPTNPDYFVKIFERGIDPDVENPENCHQHSEIPDSWPPLEEILRYQVRVRERIRNLSGKRSSDRKVGRALWLAFEHEAMHLETFIYMLLQSERVLAPPGNVRPDFARLAAKARNDRIPNQWHRIPANEFTIGINDPENDLGPDRYFGWDNERPSRRVSVPEFEALARPISNGEYARFLESTSTKQLPASWFVKSTTNGVHNGVNGYHNGIHHDGDSTDARIATSTFLHDKYIRTVFGPVPLEYAVDWPVMASYDELANYAKWANGRIPTLEETRSIYNYVESSKAAAESVPSKLISAVNGHLSNNGVEETPPQGPFQQRFPSGKPSPDPRDVFIDLDDCNVGFKNWTPEPITHDSHRLRGQSDTGGLWEWTSTPLAAFEGYKPMDLYPGYSSDFLDGKHNIILGGSYATIPRIAGRKSFVNWYQHNYPFTWATARLVRSI